MVGNDRLVEISDEHWKELRDIFRSNWPKHEFAYYLLENYIRWISVDPAQKEAISIYSLNGGWRTNQSFLLRDGFEIYFSTTSNESTLDPLARLLSLIDWEVLSEVSMDFQERYQSEKAQQICSPTLPKGFVFGRLNIHHLDYIYNQWPLKDHISYEAGHGLLARLIRLNESVGMFDSHGQLVSWCLRDQTGAHSDLQTVATHYRRGFGRMVVIELALENLRWIVVNGAGNGIARTC